ncbi:discoidin domain-containing protein [Streptomyces sp. NBC_01260]|uniref:alpha-L-rhamnosidase-related protein n=1 Tax=unclassified Streptomyces TaxID=2593676 RepID=UPI000F553223|nr:MULTISPECIES: alpha-L-rhamnosidase C-terminal domain-containing protein [unclassified Streptomyces]MCX4774576.1 discoidin domain-containing protein [Streptomyces sp. NBC_01285]RPK35218.1 Bacterial alpha-L-rhamnosidase [Streptomyces sp. ADI92-24]
MTSVGKKEQGPTRRTVLEAGVGGAASLAAGLPLVAAGTTAAAGAAPERGGSWHRYVQGPSHRTVRPVGIVRTAGDVSEPGALLAPGGRVTVLRRARPPAAPRWPQGTTAEASSTHAGNNGSDGRPRTYAADNAIDGDPDTFWNDDTEGAFPDTLTITLPGQQRLPGVTVVSNADGVPADFTVEAWADTAWLTVAAVTGNTDVQRAVRFDAPVATDRVRIAVTAVQDAGQGVFTRVNEVWPDAVDPVTAPSVTIDFGKVVVGYPEVDFTRASDNSPGVRLAFSETLQYLTERSDFTRGDQAGGAGRGTDQYAVPAGGAKWKDTKGFGSGDDKLYADGLHGFRYLKITLDALPSDAPAAQPWGEVAIDAVSLDFTAYLGTPDSYRGWFLCSDEELNRYWYGASYTNELVVDTFRRDDVDPRNAFSPSLDGKLVLHDGPKRDRDPYVGDVAVAGRTLYLTHDDAAEAARNVLADLADHQRDDGWIPPASINNYSLPLFDYPLWWVTCSWDYVLYTGDQEYAARYYPQLVKVLDTWYPSVTDEAGLLSKGLNGTSGYGDYAFLGRTGRVTYYNANYVQALRDAARIAGLLDHDTDAQRWSKRADKVAGAINDHLWDPAAGAYLDSATGPVRHAQDGNAIAITAGVADEERAASALAHLDATTRLRYGNAFMDNDTLFGGASQRVYAFTSYPELVARFETGRPDSAIDQIRRTYGWMDSHDPGITQWEGIGPDGSLYEQGYTSMAHGWSTGVLPALTHQLLGAKPTSPGYATWEVRPNPGGVRWAQGRLPTPHGPLGVEWNQDGGTFALTVRVPPGTRGSVALPTDGRHVTVRSGRRILWKDDRAYGPGVHGDSRRVTVTGLTHGTHHLTLVHTR